MARILEIASQISTPLALAGFIAGVVFLVFKQIVAKNIFPRLTSAVGAGLLRLIVDRLFILALVAMALGFAAYLVPLAFAKPPADTGRVEESASPKVDLDAVSGVVESQIAARDHAGAWNTVGDALRVEPAHAGLLRLQADVAMRWTRELRVTPPQTFSDVVAQLQPALYGDVQRSRKSDADRTADLLAHVGWGNFLRYRDGNRGFEIEGLYREAVQLDPGNPYANAMWGHWECVRGRDLASLRAHFAAALESGRERQWVRNLQLAALMSSPSVEECVELIRVCNDMRKNAEPLPEEETRRRVLWETYTVMRRDLLARLDEILPVAEHVATLDWWVPDTDPSRSHWPRFFRGRLHEASGDHEAAMRVYVSLLLTADVSPEIRDGIARCRRARPESKSEIEILGEFLGSPEEETRANAVRALSALVAEGGNEAAVQMLNTALSDPDPGVRSAAGAGLSKIEDPADPR